MKSRAMLRRIAVRTLVAAVAIAAVLALAVKRGWHEPAASGGPPTLRLITAEQYVATIHDLFGEDISIELSFAPLQRRQGLLGLGAAKAEVTPGALEEFEKAARAIAQQVVDESHRSILVPCAPVSLTQADATCARQFFGRVGRFLYRHALSETELAMLVSTAGSVGTELQDFYAGLSYGLAGMLTSPKFLYFAEVTEPDPDHPGHVRLTAYSKAVRLSLFLWNAPPDDDLLRAAEAGELHQRRALRRQIERLLASSRLEQGIRAFFADLLTFDKFDTLAKDPVIYPAFTRDVARSAEEQTLKLIVDHLLTRRGDYRDLFTTPRTFIDSTLGPLYRAPVSNPNDWVPYEVDTKHSAGVLTSLSFTTLNSHPGRSSPTRRGRAIRELLLCQKIPDPPPNVNFEIFEDPNRHFRTARERLEAHSSDPVCAGCHKLTDPIGLALENFDGAGAFRDQENGSPIDARGSLDGDAFTDVASLGRAVRDHASLGPCLASRLSAYAIGREVTVADRPWLAYISKRFAADGYRVPDLFYEIADSRGFFAVSNVPPEATAATSNASAPNRS